MDEQTIRAVRAMHVNLHLLHVRQSLWFYDVRVIHAVSPETFYGGHQSLFEDNRYHMARATRRFPRLLRIIYGRWLYALAAVRLVLRGGRRQGKWRYLPRLVIGGNDLVGAFPLDFINTYHGLQGYIGSPDTGKFGLQLFFGGIDHDSGPLSENDALDFYEGKHIALVNFTGVKFIDIALVIEGYPVDL
jgi:hypothetical protein